MSWFTKAMSSTLGKKLLMALTGLFLVIFLVVHLSGNLQLLLNDEGRAFNVYAKFMTTNPLIKTTSFILYATFIIHIVWAIMLTVNNKKSRPVGYAKVSGSNSTWSSRNMGILGTIIFIFLVIHLKNFWYVMHWGPVEMVKYDGVEYKDLYATVDVAFSQLWYVVLYVVAMLGLMFHLFHGFASAFQTLGLNHVKYNPVIKFVGAAFAIIVPAMFAAIPVIIYFKNL
ncbi:succinate dehydrogenase cytochrome b subunit [Fulvivirga sp. 29W222]|uniref:Succinate dehydrogenase cytochrome b subunit n=1 Tax=Fulvivirga marina TaxID=2494733 RepID=A0A937FT85_9BACT|nr:succinate dehydrogenase cytochrome b subunit [Fulvivirga marina]MBL6445300.1 succinate dehydrogenase cytochrome b subunit [Fulvivirga marina]